MAYATLLLHALICLGAVVLTVVLRRDARRLRAFGPRGETEDLEAFRRTFRSLRWKLPLLAGLVIGAVILAAQWAPVWRDTLPSRGVLYTLCLLAGINALMALGESHRQQWSSSGSVLGMVRAAPWSVVAFGLLMLTFFWAFGG
jgi:hypothetical protein